MSTEQHTFQSDVTKLLNIVVHSLYSEREIFLRELISNSSDACDKLRYLSLTHPDLIKGDGAFGIWLMVDEKKKTLSIADNGVGMNKEDLIENLGTIAKSGSAEFMQSLSGIEGDAKKKAALIGQFGVGFYSAFMVADRVEVFSCKAGEEKGWCWRSNGLGSFDMTEEKDVGRGCQITLFLKDDALEFLNPLRLQTIVKKYSDHIQIPVVLVTFDKKGEKKEETINAATALWMQSKSQIKDEQYKEFYHHVAHQFDDPWHWLHYQAEGKLEYTALLFIPSTRPLRLFHPQRKGGIKLYVNRVFITEEMDDLLPPYLRFMRGVVDSKDLSLNVSREMLQHNPVLMKIKGGLVKRILSELKKKREQDGKAYDTFWKNFGIVLKEGLYEDIEHQKELSEVCQFYSLLKEKEITLFDYVKEMKPDQKEVYYLTGDRLEDLKNSPFLEGFKKKKEDVLLLADPIDDFWPEVLISFEDKTFSSVAQIQKDEEKEKKQPPETEKFLKEFKKICGDVIQNIQPSKRLVDSPVCLSALKGGMNPHMEKILRSQNQGPLIKSQRVLEVNLTHPLIQKLIKKADKGDDISLPALLLLDQALMMDEEPLVNRKACADRINRLLEQI